MAERLRALEQVEGARSGNETSTFARDGRVGADKVVRESRLERLDICARGMPSVSSSAHSRTPLEYLPSMRLICSSVNLMVSDLILSWRCSTLRPLYRGRL